LVKFVTLAKRREGSAILILKSKLRYQQSIECPCNGNAEDCDEDTGICFECEKGFIGDYCDICPEGKEVERGICIPGKFYSFPLSSFHCFSFSLCFLFTQSSFPSIKTAQTAAPTNPPSTPIPSSTPEPTLSPESGQPAQQSLSSLGIGLIAAGSILCVLIALFGAFFVLRRKKMEISKLETDSMRGSTLQMTSLSQVSTFFISVFFSGSFAYPCLSHRGTAFPSQTRLIHP